MRVLFFFASLFGPLPGDATSAHDRKVLSVCEVLEEMNERAERTDVEIRGVYFGSLREESCRKSLVFDGRKWPSTINVIGPPEGSPELKNWEDFTQIVLKQSRAGFRGAIWVTMTGRLQGPWHPSDHGTRAYGGYGHLGAFPANLVVDHVSDIQLKSAPRYNYRELLFYGPA